MREVGVDGVLNDSRDVLERRRKIHFEDVNPIELILDRVQRRVL
jgi:hypothetical protein